MAMSSSQLANFVIIPVLEQMELFSESAVELLLLTAAVESDMGSFIKQVNGPALGIYQMEPDTHDDIWVNFLSYRQKMSDILWDLTSSPIPRQLVGDMYYATAMARVHYLRVPEKLPEANDVEGLARYWKKYWNTDAGAGTVEIAIEKYNKYVNNSPWALPQ